MQKARRPNPYSQALSPVREKLSISYFRAVQSGVELLRRLHMPTFASIFGGLFAEPIAILTTIAQPQEQIGFPLHQYGLNPTELRSLQAERDPVLLLAGKLANPAIMTALARTLSRNPLTQDHPLFTCQWGGRLPNLRAQEIVRNRIDEICQLYPPDRRSDVRCTLVGHSMGAIVAAIAGLDGIPVDDKGPDFTDVKPLHIHHNVGRLILIGHPLTAEIDPERIDPSVMEILYEIDGIHDVLIPSRSRHSNPSHRVSIPCGHIGLTQLDRATQYVASFVAHS
jgi:hypothetical protein